MPIRRRGNTWWLDVTIGGKRVRKSAGTTDRAAAQELHDELKARSWRTAKLGERPQKSWEQAALRYLTQYKDRNKATHIKRFTAFFKGRSLESLTEEDIDAGLQGLARPYSWNRHAATLRHLLRLARDEWNWLGRLPKVPVLPEPKRRIEWLTAAEAHALIEALPDQHKDLVRFALATGLRLGNILGLTWQQIDAERTLAWIHPDQAKAGKAIPVPLNQTAVEVLARQSTGTERVFDRKRIETKVWKAALLRAGIKRRIRFHDLRHTWASWHAQAGTPLRELQEMGAWETAEMVRRYGHLGAQHLQKWSGNIESQLRHSPSDSQNEVLQGEQAKALK